MDKGRIMTRYFIALIIVLTGCATTPSIDTSQEAVNIQLPASAQVTTDIAGKAAASVQKGVLRVICRSTSMGGTGFLHKSGNVITAAHVVKDCKTQDIVLITPAGNDFTLAAVDADDSLDLALLKPSVALPGQPLSLAPVTQPEIGMQVATWGYPGGYDGLAPLLSVGYLSGTQIFKTQSGSFVQRWVVNAAFNGGNSGGPVLSLENGTIIGVVSSKLAPLPNDIAAIIDLLGKQTSGLIYEGTKPDGSKVTYTEGQLIGEVLQYLRKQVQLVIGYSVSPADIEKFLRSRKIVP